MHRAKRCRIWYTFFRGRKFHCPICLASFFFSSLFFSPLNCFNWIGFEAQVGASGSSLRARTQSTHVHGGALNECGAWVLESIVLCVIRRK